MSECKSCDQVFRRRRQLQLVKQWNLKHPDIGIAVDVTKDDGSVLRTKTRSAAWLMGGHSAVIMVDGIAGGYSLERVVAV